MVDAVVSSVVRRLGGLLIDQKKNKIKTVGYANGYPILEMLLRKPRILLTSLFSKLKKEGFPKGQGKEIQEWKNRLDEIDRNHEIFKIRNIKAAEEGSSSMNERFKKLRRTTPYEDDQHVAGFTKDVELLTSELLQETPHQCVVSIDYNIQNLLRKTIKSFKMPTSKDELEMLEKMETEDLECHLHELLKESRYLVVIDDVWDADAWASLRRALPDNKKGSRVIITTRIKLVAESFGRRKYVHELPFLQPEESWELFCKIVMFPHYDGVNDKANRCPPRLEELARDMGRFWQHVSGDDFESHDSAHVTQILALSFTNLPHHLKLCFLYLGLFPEDFEIEVERLIRLWVAEGFIQQAEGETLEETVTEYLNELIDRNLIQVAERTWMRIRRC
ncbi:disease resistance protein RPP13-like [Camellia sinensis]|uniref:disease resistance protein RPP13-like n=1 Tax=Camellia sinensis TaxID=4442 RepID=UPI0010368BED|nr:disease resistance protein RPP13-like [Camellia sinensis]